MLFGVRHSCLLEPTCCCRIFKLERVDGEGRKIGKANTRLLSERRAEAAWIELPCGRPLKLACTLPAKAPLPPASSIFRAE